MTKLLLNQNEHLILEGRANKRQLFGSKGGRLYLTNQRIVFIAHALNFGSRFESISLGNIAMSGNTFKFKITSNLISFNISIETTSGRKERFVITRGQKNLWVEKIGEAIFDWVKYSITTPECTKGEVFSTTQIKVVDCEGCGHFVLVVGSLAKCEYCGRFST